MTDTVGITLDLPAQLAWRAASSVCSPDGTLTVLWEDHCMALPLLVDAHHWIWIYSVRMPTSCTSSYRIQTDSGLSELRRRCQLAHEGSEIIGGDWNGHVGRDVVSNEVQLGSESMLQKTTVGGKAFLRWLSSTSNLVNTDSFYKILDRGTWRHQRTGQWSDLDKYVLSMDMHKSTHGP
eukprot:652718-Pyramimonas_sp.AAC.1